VSYQKVVFIKELIQVVIQVCRIIVKNALAQ